MKNEDYTLNEDMTCASLEEILRLQNLLGFAKRFQETGDLMDGIHEEDRFYGTVPSPEALKKMEEVNRLLDVIAVNDDFTVDKFIQPKPRCRKAIVAVTAKGDLALFDGTILKVLKQLLSAADDFTIVGQKDSLRLAFGFDGLWAEHIRLDDEEVLAHLYGDEDDSEDGDGYEDEDDFLSDSGF